LKYQRSSDRADEIREKQKRVCVRVAVSLEDVDIKGFLQEFEDYQAYPEAV